MLEIDAATHTQVDNIREVIIAGLGIMPVRNRYKIFIIDEVHQLSTPSFNALLKSIEEPPPHVVFMMATTELDKIPETVLSRSQVYEFRTIGTKAIAEQLRRIVDAEGITVSDEPLQLIARDAEGSMRDAQSKLDQVIAFTGNTIGADDVTAVLGLVGRDLLLNTFQAVADEDATSAFALAGRAVEMGYDLRAVCRELSRVVRDLLVLSVDPSRINDPEIAGETERDRLKELAGRFSREDLLRAFDLLTKAEADIKNAAQPRYHLEMALLRWIYLRKLVPIEDLIAGADRALASRRRRARPVSRHATLAAAAPSACRLRADRRPDCRLPTGRGGAAGTSPAAIRPPLGARAEAPRRAASSEPGFQGRAARRDSQVEVGVLQHGRRAGAEDRSDGDRVTFTFSAAQRALQRDARAAPRVARSDRREAGWPEGDRRRRADRRRTRSRGGRGAPAGRRRCRRAKEGGPQRTGAGGRRCSGAARGFPGGNPRRRGDVNWERR